MNARSPKEGPDQMAPVLLYLTGVLSGLIAALLFSRFFSFDRKAAATLNEKLRETNEQLTIAKEVLAELEESGNEIVIEYNAYQKGKKTFQGGSFLQKLIRAVINFVGQWNNTKQQRHALLESQESNSTKGMCP